MSGSPAAAPSLFVPPGHHYSPIVDPDEAGRHLARLEARPVPQRLPGIAPSAAAMRALWAQWLPLFASMPFAAQPHAGLRYGFDNPNFAWGDGSVLHAMLRHLRPRMYIEIGSGWSSACAVDTIEGWLDGRCEAVLVDPYPDLARRLVGTTRLELTIVEQAVQELPLEVYALLQAGDILFIDSTHVLRTGSDVCFELFEVLPRLASGVVVHLHDVFWPFEYPRAWVIDDNRSWNELYALRAFLADNAQWDILFFNDFFARMERGLIQASFPNFLRNSGGSLWLRRR